MVLMAVNYEKGKIGKGGNWLSIKVEIEINRKVETFFFGKVAIWNSVIFQKSGKVIFFKKWNIEKIDK